MGSVVRFAEVRCESHPGVHDPGQAMIRAKRSSSYGSRWDQPERQLCSVLPAAHPSHLRGVLLPGVYRKHCIEQTLPLLRQLLLGNTVTTGASGSTNYSGVSA